LIAFEVLVLVPLAAVLCVCALWFEAKLQGDVAGWPRPGIYVGLLLSGLVGGVAGASLAMLGDSGEQLPWLIVFIFLCCWMSVAAWIDSRSAFVPDTLLVGVAVLLAAYGILSASSLFTFFWDLVPGGASCSIYSVVEAFCPTRFVILAILSGVLLIALLMSLWFLQVVLGRILVTPPDMLALIAPCFVFGATLPAFVSYAVLSVILAIVLSFPGIGRVIDRHGSAAEAAEELGFDSGRWGAALPLLAVAMPSLFVALACAELLPQSFAWF
jgi:hypothetical protein